MTDFLQRVSLMTLGLSPVVRPLVVSRYAPDMHLPAPELRPGEERPFESTAEHAPPTDAQNLSPSNPSLTTEPDVRAAPEQTAANRARNENAETLSPAGGARKTTRSVAAQTAGDLVAPPSTGERGASPFAEPASPARAPLNTEAPSEPENNAYIWPTEEASAKPPAGEAEMPPALTMYAERRAPPVVEGRAFERMDARDDATPRRTDAVSATAASHDEHAESYSVNESAHPAQVNEPGTQVRPAPASESGGHEHSARAALAQSMNSEHEFEAQESRALLPPRGNSGNPFAQPNARRTDAQLLSTPGEHMADLSSGRVIRVTIGRIEVHAVTPPPPSQPVEAAPPPAPRLSLDEYLRQHNGRSQ